jgi:hypothetical protein
MVSLKMVLQTLKLVGGNIWYIYEFNVVCAFSWDEKKKLTLIFLKTDSNIIFWYAYIFLSTVLS